MELKNQKVVVKVALLLFFVGLAATVEAVRLDRNLMLSQVIKNVGKASSSYSVDSACCNGCICDRRAPPFFECVCNDIFDHCPASCDLCVCTKSIPPQCRCTDKTRGRCPVTECSRSN
ncbi:hypothetical protein PIB30_075560 [Stylosanthes scabra]|uniref:Bowman-Birk serine protease inhibitors family domain-containing protein n=1 Tax=Stylosanthes scabra TaxID=79078 RepID=A0ABU6XND6_9FABA|nr:hypothetical protein [Stylosanthes scabra]